MWTRAIDLFKNQRYKESKVEYEAYLKLSPQNLEAKGQYVRTDTLFVVYYF